MRRDRRDIAGQKVGPVVASLYRASAFVRFQAELQARRAEAFWKGQIAFQLLEIFEAKRRFRRFPIADARPVQDHRAVLKGSLDVDAHSAVDNGGPANVLGQREDELENPVGVGAHQFGMVNVQPGLAAPGAGQAAEKIQLRLLFFNIIPI